MIDTAYRPYEKPTRKVRMSLGLMEALCQIVSEVKSADVTLDWGEPDKDNFYEPKITVKVRHRLPDDPVSTEGLREAINAALHELGEPGPGYPAPVANAVDILRAALRDTGPRPDSELSRDNPRSRWHQEETRTGRSSWACIPLTDAIDAIAAPRPDSGIDAERLAEAMWNVRAGGSIDNRDAADVIREYARLSTPRTETSEPAATPDRAGAQVPSTELATGLLMPDSTPRTETSEPTPSDHDNAHAVNEWRGHSTGPHVHGPDGSTRWERGEHLSTPETSELDLHGD